jgi:hypothetical protein
MSNLPPAPEGIDFFAEFRHAVMRWILAVFTILVHCLALLLVQCFHLTTTAALATRSARKGMTMFPFLFLMRGGAHAVLAVGDALGLVVLIITFVLLACGLLAGI